MFDTVRIDAPRRSPIWGLILLSVLSHILLLYQFDWGRDDQRKDDQFEVELLELSERPVELKNRLTSRHVRGGAAPTSSERDPVSEPLSKPSLSISSKLSTIDSVQSSGKISLGKGELSFPVLSESDRFTSELTPFPRKSTASIQPMARREMDGPVPAVRDVNTTALSTVSVKKEIDRRVEGGGDKSSRKGEASNGTKLTGGSRGETVPTREDRIGGEVKNRRVIYRPKPPGLDLESDVTIVLKFTVLPNGQVDQISPFTRADSRLERVAIELLSKYRFEPLFGSQKIQRGVIPFTIYRKR